LAVAETRLEREGLREHLEIKLAAVALHCLQSLLSDLDSDVPVAYLGDDATDEECGSGHTEVVGEPGEPADHRFQSVTHHD